MSDSQDARDKVPHVVALGGGYASVALATKLAGAIRQGKVRVTVIDRNNYICYHGLVPEMLGGRIQPGNLLNPLRTIFRQAHFRNGVIEKIDVERKEVLFTREMDGREFRINYDHLVLGLGSSENLNLFPGMAEHTLRLKAFQDILHARQHLINMLELAEIETDSKEQERLLNFVVAGGNYAGVEVASELADFLPAVARKRFANIPVEKIKVTLVHSGAEVLPELGHTFPDLQKYAARALAETEHLRVVTKCRLASATPEEALLNSGERIPTRTIINCTGSKASPLLDQLPFERAENGRMVMDEFCRVKGSDHIWGGGDCAAVPRRDGTPCPPLAIWALTTGAHVARNIKATVEGRPLKPYRFTGLGDACTLGKGRAAGHMRGFQFRGAIGYMAWRMVTLLYLPAWEKKVRLLLDWIMLPIFGRDIINMNVQKPVGLMHVMYEPGQEIVRQGDVGQSLFIIRSGEVEVLRESPNGGDTQCLATLGPGEHFGEVAVFRGIRRTATVRAKTRVELLHMRREAAVALSETSTEIRESLSASPGDT